MDEKTARVISSIEGLPDQIAQAWQESQEINFPRSYREAWNIVACGMGGSGLPTHLIKAAFPTRIPVELVQGYDIPSWVGENTLVFLSSYSGNTQEVLSCAKQARKRTKLVTGATGGGALAKFFQKEGFPAYIFDAKHNPSAQPRLGLGYGIFAQLGILYRLGLVASAGGSLGTQVKEAVDYIKSGEQGINEEAQALADKITGHALLIRRQALLIRRQALLIFAADHLQGNAHVFANQANETAKTFASWFSLPEANHHLLEGLKRPKLPAAGIFLESDNYSDVTKKRFSLTRDILQKNNLKAYVYTPGRGTLTREVVETLSFSSFVTFKLSVAYNEDPTATPWVDFFKKELEKKG